MELGITKLVRDKCGFRYDGHVLNVKPKMKPVNIKNMYLDTNIKIHPGTRIRIN